MTKERQKIGLNSSIRDALVIMAEGNPGAINVLVKLMEDPIGFIDVLHLDDMNMRGSQIWVGYKDHCKQDIEAFRKCIRERDPAMVATVNESRGHAPDTPRATPFGSSFS